MNYFPALLCGFPRAIFGALYVAYLVFVAFLASDGFHPGESDAKFAVVNLPLQPNPLHPDCSLDVFMILFRSPRVDTAGLLLGIGPFQCLGLPPEGRQLI